MANKGNILKKVFNKSHRIKDCWKRWKSKESERREKFQEKLKRQATSFVRRNKKFEKESRMKKNVKHRMRKRKFLGFSHVNLDNIV